jgi:hypothetical protein
MDDTIANTLSLVDNIFKNKINYKTSLKQVKND